MPGTWNADAYAGVDGGEAEPPEARSTKSANEVGTSGEFDVPLPMPGEDNRLPDKPATTPPTIANAEATATASDEIIIGD